VATLSGGEGRPHSHPEQDMDGHTCPGRGGHLDYCGGHTTTSNKDRGGHAAITTLAKKEAVARPPLDSDKGGHTPTIFICLFIFFNFFQIMSWPFH